MSRCPAAQCLSLVVVVVVILSLPQSADDDFSRTELFSFPPYDAELESTSGSGAFGSWQLSPVVTNEYGLEDFDRLHGGEIRPLTSKGVVASLWRPRFALISALDGTVQLVESKSQIPLWSFSSGPAIYSSCQAPIDQRNYFIDIGEDWQLYAYFWSDKQPINLPVTVDELSRTPKILDGVLIVGSKKITVFLLDAKSGRLMSSYQFRMSDEEDMSFLNEVSKRISVDESNAETILYITRTDYLLRGFDPISNKLLWKLAVSQIDAFFTCDGKEDPGWHLDHFISSMPGSHLHMPSSCSAVVYRPPSVLKEFVTGESLKDRPFTETSLDCNISDAFGNTLQLNGNIERSQDEALIVSFVVMSVILCAILILKIVLGVYRGHRFKNQVQPCTISDGKVSGKKKKVKKSGKNSSVTEKSQDGTGGRGVGKLFITGKEIGKGSNGTIIFEGMYEGRPVAVKRLVQAHQDAAFKEIQNLIASDRHPNIVRWYGLEYDSDFVYLSLERCTCSLDDLIQIFSDYTPSSLTAGEQSSKTFIEHKMRLDSIKRRMQDFSMWNANTYPSPSLLQLLRDVVAGLAHLHDLGIVHRDLKPQNVLIIKERILCAKLSDMGISKQLVGDTSALDYNATGCGSSGWQAPEQLLQGRQTRAVDVFSLGCVLFYCVTGGVHPFGDRLERDINIAKNKADFFSVDHIPEAVDLFPQLLNPDPLLRPKAGDVLHHPFFWSTKMRLSFLRESSDRMVLEDKQLTSELLDALENTATVALGGRWDKKMKPKFLHNLGRYRRYKSTSVRDLLRVIRNNLSHYRELPLEIQELLGSVPEGFYDYFNSRFPKLLMEVYKVVREHCSEEECFRKYFRG